MAKITIVTATRHAQTRQAVTNALAQQDIKEPDKVVQVIVAHCIECSNAYIV